MDSFGWGSLCIIPFMINNRSKENFQAMSDLTRLYPLFTEPKIVTPIWGGTRLPEWLNLPVDWRPERIGETWQVYDSNRIWNGPLIDRRLSDVLEQYGEALVGTRTMARYGKDFPLLAKFLDAAQPLSIQVHPDDNYAHTHEHATGFHGKTEAWYILEATPGATVLYGLKAPVTKAEFAGAIAGNQVEPLFHRLPVRAGEVVFVPAGTIHAIDAGITLFEIQQKSDLTYRVYDYGRTDAKTGHPRELHIEKALAVSDLTPAPRGTIPPLRLDETRQLLIACPYFALERWQFGQAYTATTSPGSFEILTVISGRGRLEWDGQDFPMGRGHSIVLPASLGDYRLVPIDDTMELLRVYVPDVEADYVAPLKAQGVDRERIGETVITR